MIKFDENQNSRKDSQAHLPPHCRWAGVVYLAVDVAQKPEKFDHVDDGGGEYGNVYGDDGDDGAGDEDLDINIEALAGGALGGLGGKLALLKEESEEGEEGVLVDLPLVRLELGLGKGRASWQVKI